MIQKEIQELFNQVISYSQNIPHPQTDSLFADWAYAKQGIYKIFGNKLIYEAGDVCFELSEDAKKERLQSFIDWVYELGDITSNLTEFLDSIKLQDFFNNRLSDTIDLGFCKVPKGMKVIKAFKYFVKEAPRLLEDLQNRASEIIQENKVNGTLCFSIHPLDFLSLSENKHQWRSCHALDGEFRAGNLSYMCDRHTIICYLKSKDDVKLPNFPHSVPWNNKKWRCLLFLDHFGSGPACMFAGRQYPFFAEGSLDIMQQAYMKLLTKYNPYIASLWSPWRNSQITTYTHDDGVVDNLLGQYYAVCGYIINEKDLIQDAPNSLHYNDLLYSSCYTPYYTYRVGYFPKPQFNLGSSVKCLRCGNNLIRTKDTMMCPDCELEFGNSDSDDYTVCDNCGNRCLQSDTTWVEGDEVCPHCAEKYTFICEDCGRRMYNVHKRYDEHTKKYVCSDCKPIEEDI